MTKAHHKLLVFGLVMTLLAIGTAFFATQDSGGKPVALGPTPEQILQREANGRVAGDSIYSPTVPAVIAKSADATSTAESGGLGDIPMVRTAVMVLPKHDTLPIYNGGYTIVDPTPTDPTPIPTVPDPPTPTQPTEPPQPVPTTPTTPTPYVAGTGTAPAGFAITRTIQEVILSSGETSTVITYATSDASNVIWTPNTPNLVLGDATIAVPTADYWMVVGFTGTSYVGSSISFQVKASATAIANAGVELGFTAEDGTRHIQATTTTKLIITVPTPVLTVLL